MILGIVGSADAPGQETDTAAAFVTAAQGRRWQGAVELTVFRNQQSTRCTLPLR